MPEVGDYSRHLQGVDAHLQRSSIQGWASRCVCGSGVRSEIYNNCSACFELFQDVKSATADQKPVQLLDIRWKSTAEIPPAPAPTRAATAEVAIPLGSSPVRRVTRARSSTSDERDHLARTSPRRAAAVPSPYLHSRGQRGRPPNGSRVGPAGFKGVRQRKGVRGYLVEIRPPKWKRTIWLGTYNSDREAAGAYDAGVFYTNKKAKYNFPVLEGTFPPLPAQLRLDNADDSDEIKTFVQQEARKAARTVKSLPVPPPEPTRTKTTQTIQNYPPPVSSATSSSEEYASDPEIGLNIPQDDDYLLQQMMLSSTFWDSWPSMHGGFECMTKQEYISLDLDSDDVHSGLMHPLP